MSLSVKTVHTYRTRLLKKLGLQRTGELVRFGVEEGLTQELQPPPPPPRRRKSGEPPQDAES